MKKYVPNKSSTNQMFNNVEYYIIIIHKFVIKITIVSYIIHTKEKNS